jgi:hypothetical protein
MGEEGVVMVGEGWEGGRRCLCTLGGLAGGSLLGMDLRSRS